MHSKTTMWQKKAIMTCSVWLAVAMADAQAAPALSEKEER
jgi:hypothetical protein